MSSSWTPLSVFYLHLFIGLLISVVPRTFYIAPLQPHLCTVGLPQCASATNSSRQPPNSCLHRPLFPTTTNLQLSLTIVLHTTGHMFCTPSSCYGWTAKTFVSTHSFLPCPTLAISDPRCPADADRINHRAVTMALATIASPWPCRQQF